MQTLKTTDAVIEELGSEAIQQLTGRGRTAVANWRARQKFPPETYLVLQQALEAKKLAAPSTLWGMERARQSALSPTGEG